MRATEFITEDAAFDEYSHDQSTGRRKPRGGEARGPVTQYFADVSPGAQAFDGLDKYYDLYRMSLIMAGGPDDLTDIDPASWISNAPFVSGYTDADDAKIMHAAKKLKGVARVVAPPGSREPADTNTASPVVSFRGYAR